MYSPKERLYNTPDMTGPTGNAILQQIRLESILRKYGRLACCEPYVYSSKPVTRKLPELKPQLRSIRPFEEQRPAYEKVWRQIDNPSKAFTGRSEKSIRRLQVTEEQSNRNKRSGIPGAPVNDPFLQRHRDTVGGCKYGGPNLGESDTNRPNAKMFKPFYPQKSPRRLPCIQREKGKTKGTLVCGMNVCFNPDNDLAKHINILEKQRSHELAKMKFKESKKRKKKTRLEQEFHQWEQAQDAYLHKIHSLESDHQILRNLEKFHDADNKPVTKERDDEQLQRTRISDEIKRGVQRKLHMFQKDDEKVTERFIPVCNMTFENDTDVYYQEKTTVYDGREKDKPKQ